MDCSMPGFPVLHCLPELAQTHVHWIGDAIQLSHPLSSSFPPGFPGGSEVKASACNAGDVGLIPGLGRSPGEGNGNPFQYSCWEMDRGAWWAIIHRVGKSQTWLKWMSIASLERKAMTNLDSILKSRYVTFPSTARSSNQSILKEINPEYSLEGLLLRLRLQCFDHQLWRANSLEKILMVGKIEARRRRRKQRMQWLDGIINSMDMSLS